jgi:polar amino acid transport system substrate-binding protein
MIRPIAVIRSIAMMAFAVVALGCAQRGDAPDLPEPEPSGLARILERGELRVGMSGEQPPLNMTTRTGEMVGLEVALARVLASTFGVELQIVRKRFAELLAAVESKEIDLAMSGIGITPARSLRVGFVGPYFVSGKSLLSASKEILGAEGPDALNRPGLRVAALAGSTSEDYVRRHLPKAKLLATAGLDAAVGTVLRGEADALLADLETCHFGALRHPDSGLEAREVAFTTEPIGIAVARDDPQLANLLETYLEALDRQGALAKARDYWFENDEWLQSLR